jgi:hypothetical protein
MRSPAAATAVPIGIAAAPAAAQDGPLPDLL